MFSKHCRVQFSKYFHEETGHFLVLVALWLVSVAIDRIWLALDRSVPSWDPADHLIGSLNYWWMLQKADWFSRDWWNGIWTLSSKYPPLLYLSTAPFNNFFGQYADAAIGVNVLYTAILLGSTYGIGRLLFNSTVGLWAAGLCVLFPQFYTLRSQYFMDYPLTALVTAAFFILTCWKESSSDQSFELSSSPQEWGDACRAGIAPFLGALFSSIIKNRWFLAIAFGILFGLASLMKQTAVMFLGIPLLWLGLSTLVRRQWGRFLQLVVGGAITGLMMLPWSRTNWLFQISAAFSANTRSAEIEGDPSGFTVAGWTYYLSHLPQAVSYPLLLIPLLGVLLWGMGITAPRLRQETHEGQPSERHYTQISPLRNRLIWLAIFLSGTYVIWSAIANKDVRYIMPYLPVISVVLGLGMVCWRGWWRAVPWATVGITGMLMLSNLFSVVGDRPPAIAKLLTPAAQHPLDVGDPWPHADIVAEMVQTQPYQIMNLGVLPSTPEVNQHNLNYFGNRAAFQVYARRMGKSQEHIEQDLRSLDWFVSVTRPQLNHHDHKSRRRQLAIARDLRRSPDFQRQRSWDLPDGSRLDLFRRKQLPIQVEPLEGNVPNSIQLANITVPDRIAPNQPIPVTYQWEGNWDALTHGTVILTWHKTREKPEESTHWFHDHSIGMGTLRPQPIQANQTVNAPAPIMTDRPFRVTEHLAMQPPDTAEPGSYTLNALYLNTLTGETTPLDLSFVTLTLDPTAPPVDAPKVDWVSQLRQLSTALPQGIDALDPVFDQIGRFSLYDPIQSYAVQAETALTYRLQTDPTNLEVAYALTLTQVLQRDAEGAIATLNHITQLDGDNPYAHAYLAFVNLYDLRPHAAREAIDRAIALDPNAEEFKALRAVASLMGGNLWQAWQDGRSLL